MKILNQLFPDRAELEAVKSERDTLAQQNESLRDAEAAARRREIEDHETIRKLRDDLNITRDKLREQTDADLLLVSQRIINRILDGETPEKSAIIDQQRLIAQRQSLLSAAQYNIASQTAGGYNGMGLGALLGGAFR